MTTIKGAARGLVSRAQELSKAAARRLEKGVDVELGPVKAHLGADGVELASTYTEDGERHDARLKIAREAEGGWRVERQLVQGPAQPMDTEAILQRRERYRTPLGTLPALTPEQTRAFSEAASRVPNANLTDPRTGVTPADLAYLDRALEAYVRQHPFGELLLGLGASPVDGHYAVMAALELKDGNGVVPVRKRLEQGLARQTLQLQDTLASRDWSSVRRDPDADAQSLDLVDPYTRPAMFANRFEAYAQAMAMDAAVYDEIGVQAADVYLRAATRVLEDAAKTYPRSGPGLADPVALLDQFASGPSEADYLALLLLAEAKPDRAQELGRAYFSARNGARAVVERAHPGLTR